ncbi:hypothetical protein DFH06DRAFT_1297774 [Mycena polygramma]|nr:hypothetical protein DFH06DRAFT_1297774 [Mycena polygramma]
MAFLALLGTVGLATLARSTLAQNVYCPSDSPSHEGLNVTLPPNPSGSDFIPCTYGKALSSCDYFTNGSLRAQDNTLGSYCPSTINPAHLNSTGFTCMFADTKGTSLFGSSVTTKQELACTYNKSLPYMCTYDTSDPNTRKFFVSHHIDPYSITLSELIETRSMCLQADNAGGNLTSASITSRANDTMACTYDNHNMCTYVISNGTFNSGPSACPQSISPVNGTAGSVPVGAIDAAAAAPSSSPDKKNDLPKPVILAFLAMNGALVLGILILGGFWVFRRHSESKRSVDYTKVHASREEDYYDAPIKPYRPPNRQESQFI